VRFETRVPAKVNLSLLVGPRRADGYHELFSVFLPIDLYDRLEFDLQARSAAEGPGALRLYCESVPGESNLAARALRSLERATGWVFDGFVHISKGIPVGAGLGGGSADAAAALSAGTRVIAAVGGPPVDDERLRSLAVEIGADVPFFLKPAPCFARGIGDVLEPLELPPLPLILIFHREQLSTAVVYEEFDRIIAGLPGGTADRPPPKEATRAEDHTQAFENRSTEFEERWRALAGRWKAERRPSDQIVPQPGRVGPYSDRTPFRLKELLQNDLEKASFRLMRGLRRDKDILLKSGALGAVMSGSGPTLLGVCRTRPEADALVEQLSQRGYRVRSVNGGILP
jgi:4-diphosphocytidyl-2-C-methyl-D-erythritol kinase